VLRGKARPHTSSCGAGLDSESELHYVCPVHGPWRKFVEALLRSFKTMWCMGWVSVSARLGCRSNLRGVRMSTGHHPVLCGCLYCSPAPHGALLASRNGPWWSRYRESHSPKTHGAPVKARVLSIRDVDHSVTGVAPGTFSWGRLISGRHAVWNVRSRVRMVLDRAAIDARAASPDWLKAAH
jgi:hypothetical protein